MPRLPSPSDLGGALAPRPSRGVTEHRPAVLDRGTEFLADLGVLAEKETERLDGLAAEDALNRLKGIRVDLTLGEGKGFQHVRGGAVIERPVLREFPDAFNREIEHISQGLRTGRARQRFQEKAQPEALGFRTDLMRHVAAQTDAFAGATFKATVQVEAGVAGAMYADPIAVSAALQRVEERTADEAVRLGMTGKDSQDLLLAFSQQNAGAVVSAAIKGALGNNDSPTAMALLEQYGGKLSEEQRRGLDTAVKSANAWDVGQSLAEEAFAMTQAGVSATKVEQYLIDNTRGNQAAYGNAQAVLGQLMGARQEQRKEASEGAQDEINRGANWGAIRHKYLDSMSPEAVAAFDARVKATAEGKKPTTDNAIWNGLMTTLSLDPAAFRQLDLNEFTLSDSDYKVFRRAQLEPGKAITLRSVEQHLSDAQLRMAEGKTRMKPQDIGDFRDYVYTKLDELIAREGREPHEHEIIAVIREARLHTGRTVGGYLGTTFGGRPERGYQAPRGDAEAAAPGAAAPGRGAGAPAPVAPALVPAAARALIIEAWMINAKNTTRGRKILEEQQKKQGFILLTPEEELRLLGPSEADIQRTYNNSKRTR